MSRHLWTSISSRTASLAPRSTGLGRAYCRLTLAFVIGLYLPMALDAPDLARHLGEALHSWAVVFFAPLALWGLMGQRGDSAPLRKRAQDEPGKR